MYKRQRWIPALAAAYLEDGRAAAHLGDVVGARAALDRVRALGRAHGMPGLATAADDVDVDVDVDVGPDVAQVE